MIVDQYKRQFLGLRQYLSYQYDEALLTQHFVRGLKDSISGDFRLLQPKTLALEKENEEIVEGNVARGSSNRSGT